LNYSLSAEGPLGSVIQHLGLEGYEMRCYFHLIKGHDEILDDTGIEVSDLQAAKAQAQQAADELRHELDEAIKDWNGWRLDIVCPEGSLLYSLSLGITLH
jgi:hypothetical protein